MATVDETLERLNRSKFRSSFKLSKKDVEYINEKGLSQLDAEAVNSFSSAYKSTAESEVAAKKPHKNEENRQFFGGFQLYEKFALENQ